MVSLPGTPQKPATPANGATEPQDVNEKILKQIYEAYARTVPSKGPVPTKKTAT